VSEEDLAAANSAASGVAAAHSAGADAPLRQPSGPQLRLPNQPGGSVADSRILELEAQIGEHKQQLQRLAADFENYRRRAAAEKDELVRFAASRVMENFLPIVDNFERAQQHLGKADPESLRQGVELIYRQIADFLTRQGVAPMEAVGQTFDPNLHEAIGQTETTDHPDNTVLFEVQRGYYLNGRVLRHAMVHVTSNPEARYVPPATNPETNQSSEESAGMVDDQTADASAHHIEQDFTLEDLMAEAQAPEGTKEESHG
jgi:molecular chaperone GrpE